MHSHFVLVKYIEGNMVKEDMVEVPPEVTQHTIKEVINNENPFLDIQCTDGKTLFFQKDLIIQAFFDTMDIPDHGDGFLGEDMGSNN